MQTINTGSQSTTLCGPFDFIAVRAISVGFVPRQGKRKRLNTAGRPLQSHLKKNRTSADKKHPATISPRNLAVVSRLWTLP